MTRLLQFFEYGEASNVINPIYIANEANADPTLIDLAGAFEIGKFLDMLTGKGQHQASTAVRPLVGKSSTSAYIQPASTT